MIDGCNPDRLLDGLTDAQRLAVTSPAAPLCILAGAGAGKTRVLTRRIAYRCLTGAADPAHVLALTFTRRAAGELADRLRATGQRDPVVSGTFHAVAGAQLRRWWADRGVSAPTLLDRKTRLLAPLVDARPSLAGITLSEIASHIEWAKARVVAPESFAAACRLAGRSIGGSPCTSGGGQVEDVAAVYARYEHEKRRRGLVDFDDLLARCADAVESDPTFAAAQRWRWRHVFVDEFQDLNPLQYRLLTAWLGERRDACVVGDPNQAVYGWNGADPDLLATLPERWPGTEVIRLDANHRCSPEIVAAAAAVLGEPGVTLTSTRPAGPAVAVRSHPSGSAEAKAVAAGLRRARHAGTPWRHMAVLVRTNAQGLELAAACRAAGVPVRTPGLASLLEHPTARAALAELGRRPGLPVAAVGADLDEWGSGCTGAGRDAADAGDAGDAAGAAGAADAADAASAGAAGAADAADAGDAADAADALRALANLAREAGRIDQAMTVAGWLAWLPAALARDADADDVDAVTVCTFHRAKGLEWEAVWVCGLETGLVPIGRATTAAALAEERRLLYVALTRAGRELHCSWAEQRRFGAADVPRQPSPWLHLIARAAAGPQPMPAPADAGAEPTPEEWQRRLRDQRDRLRAGASRRRRQAAAGGTDWPTPDPVVLEALRSWRADVARGSAVPAHVVLHDTVLTALAALRPESSEALLAIPGLGPVKVERFGPGLLALLADHAASA